MSTRQKGIVNIRLRRSVKRITQDSLNDHRQNAVYRTAHYVRDNCEFDSTLWLERDDHAKLRANAVTSLAVAPMLTLANAKGRFIFVPAAEFGSVGVGGWIARWDASYYSF